MAMNDNPWARSDLLPPTPQNNPGGLSAQTRQALLKRFGYIPDTSKDLPEGEAWGSPTLPYTQEMQTIGARYAANGLKGAPLWMKVAMAVGLYTVGQPWAAAAFGGGGAAGATGATMPATTMGIPGPIAGLPLYDAAGKIIAGSAAAGAGAGMAGATTGPTLAQELAGRAPSMVSASRPWWETAAKIGVPVGAAALLGGKGADTSTKPFDEATLAQIQELLSMAIGRQKRTEPLHEAAMAMATRLAPSYARNAMGSTPTPSAPASDNTDTQSTIDQFLNSLGR